MPRRDSHRLRALSALALLAALVLIAGGCGGEDSDQGETQQSAAQAQSGGEGEEQEGASSDPTGTAAAVRGFGKRVQGAQRTAVVRAFRAYFTALAADDYAAACTYFTDSYKRVLAVGLLPKQEPPINCRQLGAALHKQPDLPTADAGNAIDARIVRVGIRGDRASVLYRPKGERLSFITMTRERGRWRTISLVGAELRP